MSGNASPAVLLSVLEQNDFNRGIDCLLSLPMQSNDPLTDRGLVFRVTALASLKEAADCAHAGGAVCEGGRAEGAADRGRANAAPGPGGPDCRHPLPAGH